MKSKGENRADARATYPEQCGILEKNDLSEQAMLWLMA
jgi:hypothetical protein